MATIGQIRGMLLEEAILSFLRISGYRTVSEAGGDPTLVRGPAGLCVKGRGDEHQIDAIADFLISPPFSYPHRLLIEAKCYAEGNSIGLPIARNAVGVLKDVSEYWVSNENPVLDTRYHYLFALFSTSQFTKPAQRYAFAQDIYLMPLGKSQFIKPLVEAIMAVEPEHFDVTTGSNVEVDLRGLRRTVRRSLRGEVQPDLWGPHLAPTAQKSFLSFYSAAQDIPGAVLGMIAHRFPVFLVPAPDVELIKLRGRKSVRIFWNEYGWLMLDSETGRPLFSFDIPEQLFLHYLNREGRLTPGRALGLKRDYLREIQVLITPTRHDIRALTLRLDMDWLTSLEKDLRRAQAEEASDE